MKIAVLGDIHSNLEALEAVLDEARRLAVEKFVCIGDIVGYNANPHECLEIVRALPGFEVIIGNHDAYISSDRELVGFNPQAAQAVEWTREQLNAEELTWLSLLPFKKDIFLTNPNVRFSLFTPPWTHPMRGAIFLTVMRRRRRCNTSGCPFVFLAIHIHHSPLPKATKSLGAHTKPSKCRPTTNIWLTSAASGNHATMILALPL